MKQLEGFSALGKEGKVCRLIRSLYVSSKYQNNGIKSFTMLYCLVASKSTNVINAYMIGT